MSTITEAPADLRVEWSTRPAKAAHAPYLKAADIPTVEQRLKRIQRAFALIAASMKALQDEDRSSELAEILATTITELADEGLGELYWLTSNTSARLRHTPAPDDDQREQIAKDGTRPILGAS